MSRCIGCGIILQDRDANLDGYVSSTDKRLCLRCFNIKNYGKNMIVNRDNDDYMKIIDSINDDDLVVYVASLLTLNLDFLKRFKKVIVVLTKRDVIPKSVKDVKLINYVKDRYKNVCECLTVSAFKKYNLDELYCLFNKYNDKKIYFVGETNSGKSTLINEMIKSYNGTLGEITTSNYPSTTLGIVNVKIGNLNVYDTPGIVNVHSIINYLNNKDIKYINNKSEIKPVTMQINGKGSILVDKFFRIDYDVNIDSLTFYMSSNIKISKISNSNYRFKDSKNIVVKLNDNHDIVIDDIGFIKCTKKGIFNIYYDDDLSVRVRDNLI